MTNEEIVIGLPGYQLTWVGIRKGGVWISTVYRGPRSCPHCGSQRQRSKGQFQRVVRHADLGLRHCWLEISARKWLCLDCGRQFRQRLPGILPGQHATEPFREAVFRQHLDGINRSRLGKREGIGAATVERYFRHGLKRQFSEWHSPKCPPILGIDEHFFTRRKGFATTLCDLKNHTVYDVALGRSEASLTAYFAKLEGKDQVRIVCMDLSSTYRALVEREFPKACIVADRFHVIRLVNHHFLACWREIDPAGSKSRGLVSLMRPPPPQSQGRAKGQTAGVLASFPRS